MDHNFIGFADQIRHRTLVGWVCDHLHGDVPLTVQIIINGNTAGFVEANQFRQDLLHAGMGNGLHGFEFPIPDHVREIRSLDAYVANTDYRLQSSSLDFAGVNEYLGMFPSSAVGASSDVLSGLLEPAFVNSLMKRATEKADEYQNNIPFPYISFDDFLPQAVAQAVLDDFPEPKRIDWTHHDYGYAKKKLAFSAPESLPPVIRDVLYFLNTKPVLDFLERLTGIEGLIPDPYFVGGGLHQIETGGKLDVHIDFNRHNKLKLDRRINLLLYLNKDWPESYGGALELWNRSMTARDAAIFPLFNRCAIFNTSEWSYHGHPDPLTCPAERSRKSMALYYYSNGRPEEEVAEPHLTVWKERPQEKPV
jgi:hypothetical protein